MAVINWKTASPEDLRLLEIISNLMGPHLDLLEIIFDSDKPQLRRDSKTLCEEAGYLSCGEVLLVRIALDIWNGEGQWSFSQSLGSWDTKQWLRLINAVCQLRAIDWKVGESC